MSGEIVEGVCIIRTRFSGLLAAVPSPAARGGCACALLVAVPDIAAALLGCPLTPAPLPPGGRGVEVERWTFSQSASCSGSRTVAERPRKRQVGDHVARVARPRARRSPRFDGAMAWISSMMTHLRSAKKLAAWSDAISRASCSGVVSRISGGVLRWRWRTWVAVSPVRVSMRMGKAISETGVIRLRCTSAARALRGEM